MSLRNDGLDRNKAKVNDTPANSAKDDELRATDRLLRLAGQVVRLGGWRVDLLDYSVSWTEGVAAIHGLPAGYAPDFDEGIDYFAPEEQDGARAVFRACAEHGTPFNDVRQIIDANGKRIWVRSVGEAEYDASGAIIAVQGAMQDITELVEARAEAEALSRKLIDTFESIRDALLTVDREWRLVLVNSEAARTLRRPRSEMIGQSIWEVLPEAIGTMLWDRLHLAMAAGRTVRFVTYMKPLRTWFDVAVFPSAEGLSVYFQDVTAQRALEKQHKLLETAVSRQNDTLVITDATGPDPAAGKIVYVNDAFTRLTGYSRSEAIGRSPRMLQGPATQRDQLDRIRAALTAHQPVRAEVINYRKGGASYWLELDITPIKDDAGNLVHFVAVQRDITERKVAEAEARMQDERFRLAAEATTDVIWDWDITNDRIWWSGAMAEVHGHAHHAESSAADWQALIYPDDCGRVVESTRRVLERAENYWQDEYRIIRADGSHATVIDRGSVIRDAEGRPLRMIGNMADMTELRSLEARLRQSQRLEAVGQLTGGISHDINNLLTIIMGNAELLSDQLGDRPNLRELADITVDAAGRGADLTARLLAFGRRQPLQSLPVDVDMLFRGTDALLRRTLPAHITLEYRLAAGLWPALVDCAQLEAALLNMTLNSRDAMPDGGLLRIGAANVTLAPSNAGELAAGDYLEIIVSDTGTGMSRDTAQRAFDPFFTTKPAAEGSGLGLSMVYGFARQSKGRVTISSKLGMGTTVRLLLPRASAGPAQDAPTRGRSGAVAAESASSHVLLVEDDLMVADYACKQLESLGYRVTTAHHGRQALEILENRPTIDLLFTDIVMPGEMSGRELALAARARRPNLKVLFTSGYDEVPIDQVLEQRRIDMLRKPYRKRELAEKIRAALTD